MPQVVVESLDQEGRGVAHLDGKAIFIDGALPGETVEYSSYRRKPRYDLASVTRVVAPSAQRVAPRCRYFGLCGGCSLQHLDERAQVAAKQRKLEDDLARIGNVTAGRMLPPIYGPAWQYRYRARFSVRFVPKKGGVLVGFHERRHSYVADMLSCEVVPARVSRWLPALRELVGGLSIRARIPQIELALGDDRDALVLRVLDGPDAADREKLCAFAQSQRVTLYLQPRGPDSVHALWPEHATEPEYRLPEFDLALAFGPTEFTQVNPAVNRVLVRCALALLEPRSGERVADMFCGIGNFSLAIARRGATATGFEGSRALVSRAGHNAERNGLAARARFVVADLFSADPESAHAYQGFDRMLIDPPRDGAVELVKSLEPPLPTRVVYVSCNPATLARDAAVLVHTKGYRLDAAGVVNMFPHTAHVESIAAFERQ